MRHSDKANLRLADEVYPLARTSSALCLSNRRLRGYYARHRTRAINLRLVIFVNIRKEQSGALEI